MAKEVNRLTLASQINPSTWSPPASLTFIVVTLLAWHAASSSAERAQSQSVTASPEFPQELVDWAPRAGNPVFKAEGPGHWDVKIRERGWILREDDAYHLWFTGYDGTRDGIKRLGYATSPDGIHWTPSAKNPLLSDRWVEDMMVVKCGDTYYMFAEGSKDNHTEMLTSKDRLNWKLEGPLDVRPADGKSRVDEPCGTPTIWIENDTWYLFYERLDKGIWLAKSNDVLSRVWINVRDEPILAPGPSKHDSQMIALNQIIKHHGVYYAFYHASGDETLPRKWNTNVARSTDLIRWQKFAGNPIVEDNKSSGIVIRDGRGYRLYTMHDQVDAFTSRSSEEVSR